MNPSPPTRIAPETRPCPPTRRTLRSALSLGLGCAVLLAATLSGCSRSADGSAGSRSGGEWYEARVQSFDLTIVESGSLEAFRKVEIKSSVDGRPAIIEVVEEGIDVKAGDQLVLLDSAEITEKLATEQLQLETARADKIAAEQQLAIQITTAQAEQRAAEVALLLAELELAEWEQGEVPTKQRELQLALDKAQREVERTKRNFETDKELFAQNFISQDELEDSEIDVIEAADALATARLNIDVYDRYTNTKERQEFQSAVDDAKADLEKVLAENISKLAQAQAKAESERRGLELQELEVASALEQLANSRIVAPQDGMVVYASSIGRYRDEPIAEGRQVRNSETILVLPDTSQLVAVLSVPEALAPQVRAGQPVDVTVDAIPDQVFRGEVVSVSVLAEDGGWWNNNVKNFTVRVLLPPGIGDGRLKPTMTATGTVYTGRVDDAVAVPIQAVFAEGSQRFVYVAAGMTGGVRRQPVEIGRASETLVEITSGLDAGTAVLLRAPRPGEEVNS